MRPKLIVVKIGGNVIDDEALLSSFLKDFAQIQFPKILIHGGGKLATKLSQKLGIPTLMHQGRRITDADTLQIVTMTYAGWINKKIVAQLQKFSCNAIGLTGADAAIVPATKRPIKDIDYGFVADLLPEKINLKFLETLIQQNLIPIIAPITADNHAQLLNVNADSMAQAIAEALATNFNVELLYCFELNGVLKDINDKNSIIEKISTDQVDTYKSNGTIQGGMIPKIDNATKAIQKGVTQVIIGNAQNLLQIVNQEQGYGTRIYK